MTTHTTTVAHEPALDIDPFAIDVLLDPLPCDAAVREAAPAVWVPKYGFWAVGRHQHVQAIFMDWKNYSSASGTGLTNTKKETPWRVPSVILEVDPPAHTRTRSVLAKILSPASMARMRDDFQKGADELVERLVEQREFDAAEDLAAVFPMKVVPDAVGLPEVGREHLLPYANINFNAMGPKNELYHNAVAAAGDAPEWVVRQCMREQLKPEGFGADIYAAMDRGELNQEEAQLLVRVFLTAAIDTTIYGMGLGIHAFASFPDQWDLLRDGQATVRNAFEEILRYSAPSPFIGRTTTCETEIEGVRLGAEEKVLMFVAAANRDPRKWPDADVFDVKRKTTGQLAFGTGIHGCVGQMVARLEAEVIFNALIKRVRRIELNGEPVLRPTNWLRGFAKLPVRVHPL